MAKRNTPAGMVVLGFQTISLANSTALGLNSTCLPAHLIDFSVETNSCRYRTDATAPTLNTGVLLETGHHYLFDTKFTNLKFQRQTGTSKLSLMAYKYVGE